MPQLPAPTITVQCVFPERRGLSRYNQICICNHFILYGWKWSEGNQNVLSPNMPLWHENYFELKAIKEQTQKKLPLRCLKAGYKFSFYWRQINLEMTPEEFANKRSSICSLPCIYLSTVCCPLKPEVISLCPVISLRMYCPLEKMLSGLEF